MTEGLFLCAEKMARQIAARETQKKRIMLWHSENMK